LLRTAAIYHLFPILQKSHDLIFIYSPGIRATRNPQPKMLSLSDDL